MERHAFQSDPCEQTGECQVSGIFVTLLDPVVLRVKRIAGICLVIKQISNTQFVQQNIIIANDNIFVYACIYDCVYLCNTCARASVACTCGGVCARTCVRACVRAFLRAHVFGVCVPASGHEWVYV